MKTETNMTEATYTYDDAIVSDLHKDVYGFRPTEAWWTRWEAMTQTQKQVCWDDLCRSLELELEHEEKRRAAAVADLEARVAELIELGAHDWDMAIRWIMQAHEVDPTRAGWTYAREELEYDLGLPYGYIASRAGY